MNRMRQPEQHQDTQPAVALWEFVPVADYRLPRSPGKGAASSAWTSLKRLFRRADDDKQAPLKAEADLRALPHVRLDHLVRPIDCGGAAAALDVALADWMRSSVRDRPVRFVVGQPFCGHVQILQHWAARHDAAKVEPPGYDQILAGDARWMEQCRAQDRLWVLPNLEHCYLRHAGGLAHVRWLLEHAASGRSGRAVIGCDSWAWAYLKHVSPIPRPDALTLQAFDGARLSRYFAESTSAQSRARLQFRDARNGRAVLSVPAEANDEVSAQINDLAAHCRGNVGMARWYWRERLRSEPEKDEEGSERIDAQEGDAVPQAEIIWVSTAAEDPTIPDGEDDETVLVLHALLLHDGLPATLLPDLLPLPHYRIVATLLLLKDLGVVQSQGDRWSVSALGYAAVRQTLLSHGYLTDGF